MQASHTDRHPFVDFPTKEERRLGELHRWLTYEGLTAAALPFSYVNAIGVLLPLLIAAAVVFTPYMLLRLYQCNRRGWMIGFGVGVGLPLVLLLFLFQFERSSAVILALIPLVSFYFYTWLLRHSVGEWIEELSWERRIQKSTR